MSIIFIKNEEVGRHHSSRNLVVNNMANSMLGSLKYRVGIQLGRSEKVSRISHVWSYCWDVIYWWRWCRGSINDLISCVNVYMWVWNSRRSGKEGRVGNSFGVGEARSGFSIDGEGSVTSIDGEGSITSIDGASTLYEATKFVTSVGEQVHPAFLNDARPCFD